MAKSRTLRPLAFVAAFILALGMFTLSSSIAFVAAHAGEKTASHANGDCEDADEGDNEHPSGKDRSCENGSLGSSSSDPDGDENGGEDKPDGGGGTDRDDQDGNNGCGNDDDFEDDNNGNCGGKDEGNGSGVEGDDDECEEGNDDQEEDADEDGDDDEVCPTSSETPTVIATETETGGATETGDATGSATTSVLGVTLTRPAAGGLAATGAGMLPWLASAAAAVGLGGVLRRASKGQR